jgi:site-specific recombinase XerD
MDKAELDKIMGLYKSHLQVKKLLAPDTISLYLSSIKMFVSFCENFHKKLAIPDKWLIKNLGVREIEAFMQHQMNVLNWKRSTMVTCISSIKIFYQFLAESENVKNPIQHFKLPRDINDIGQRSIEICKINQLFELSFENSLQGHQQRLLLEFIYGLGMSLAKITKIRSAIPELDEGQVRIYFQDSKYRDVPFSPVSIKVLKSYLKLIDNIDGDQSFWINNKGRILTAAQLQNILNKYFVQHKLPPISANELRDLSVQHFSGKGADIRSLQALRHVKQLRRLQSLKDSSFVDLQKKIRQKHLRNQTSNKEQL